MTGPDLIRLAEDLAQCGGIHRLTNCLAAACHVFAEHERRAARTVEAWEDGPECGAGMSDKTVRCGAASAAPARDAASGGICGRVEARGAKSIDLQTTAVAMCNPHPITPERGERQPLPMRAGNAISDEERAARLGALAQAQAAAIEARGGITHGPGSPIVAEHSGPSDRRVPRFDGKRINPELTDGDGA